jgi:hypothetical protein
MIKLTLTAATIFALSAPIAIAAPGSASDPIRLKMRPGAEAITVHGVLRQNVDCCTYAFKAAAGQQLSYKITGAVARLVITSPNGDSDGPNFETPKTLPATGAYTLSVSPDLMAEGAFGAFTLTLTIPPKR